MPILNATPPANVPSGFYQYNVTEYDAGTGKTFTQLLNISLNMSIVKTQPTNGSYSVIQYFPDFITNAFALQATPVNYLIDGYLNTSKGTAHSHIT